MKEKIEYFTLKPNLKQFFGRTVTKELKFDEYTDNKKVHQVLDNCILTTYVTDENESTINGIKEKVLTKEESKIIQTLPEGTILIWSEEQGYIVPDWQMVKLEEIIDEAEDILGIYKGEENEFKGNENKNI